jgi:uncharacterized protein
MRVYRLNPKKNLFSSLSMNSKLILLNVLFFLIFFVTMIVNRIFNFFPEGFLYEISALRPINVLNGKYLWTFLTSMFMHAGFFHLLMNMISLFFVGSFIERILGAKRFLWFYLFSGLFAGVFFVLVSILTSSELGVYAVGASGAIFALVGLLVILTPNLPVYLFLIPIPIKIKYAAPGILIFLWAISIAGNIPIGNSAHLGGLLAGLAYGFYLRIKFKRKTEYLRKHFS